MFNVTMQKETGLTECWRMIIPTAKNERLSIIKIAMLDRRWNTLQFRRATEESIYLLLREVYTSYGQQSIRASVQSVDELSLGLMSSYCLQSWRAYRQGDDKPTLLAITSIPLQSIRTMTKSGNKNLHFLWMMEQFFWTKTKCCFCFVFLYNLIADVFTILYIFVMFLELSLVSFDAGAWQPKIKKAFNVSIPCSREKVWKTCRITSAPHRE